MKYFSIILILFTVLLSACEPQATITPTDPIITPTTSVKTNTATPEVFSTPTPTSEGTEVSYGPLTIVLPAEIADGASGKDMMPFTDDDSPWWEKTPGHTEVNLGDYYILEGKSLQPIIYIYPATDYAILSPNAFESMHRLRNITSGVVEIAPDQLPPVPFFNAAQTFASNIQLISFQNGDGIRFLTEYAQYPAPINNQELFYQFQGFSDDGEYYIVAILPITMSKLADNGDVDSPLPDGGIPYSYFTDNDNFDAEDYYAKITDLLNSATPELFSPAINQLDTLIQSMVINPYVVPTEISEENTATPEAVNTPTPFSDGTKVTYGPMTLVLPAEIADGASGKEVLPFTADDAAWWQKAPGHTQIDLGDYYILQDKTHKPTIYIYPATEYAILVPTAFESMHRLRNVISGVVPLSIDQLPAIPFFNAAQVFASNIEEISFQNGSGIRFLTEYAQYAAPVNNKDLFYQFQGLSDDGEFYIVAILPITMSKLAETSDEDADLPDGGIPYTYFSDNDNFDAQDYYAKITDLLNSASPESFTPSISQLDALIQSMVIEP